MTHHDSSLVDHQNTFEIECLGSGSGLFLGMNLVASSLTDGSVDKLSSVAASSSLLSSLTCSCSSALQCCSSSSDSLDSTASLPLALSACPAERRLLSLAVLLALVEISHSLSLDFSVATRSMSRWKRWISVSTLDSWN